MNDDLVRGLRARLSDGFQGVRRIAVLVVRDGRLVLAGEPTCAQITSAAMLLASVHTRLPWDHAYASPSVPAAALLRLVESSDRGSILLAPVIAEGVVVGAIVVEAERGRAFTRDDLARLESMVDLGARAVA